MQEPIKRPLTANPRSKNISKIPMPSVKNPRLIDIGIKPELLQPKNNENHSQNDPQSIPELESDATN